MPSEGDVMERAAVWTNQRLFDLVRQQRMELFQADLIDGTEYAMLAMEHAAVARLEDYDEIRGKLAAAEAREKGLREALERQVQACWCRRAIKYGEMVYNPDPHKGVSALPASEVYANGCQSCKAMRATLAAYSEPTLEQRKTK